jgi:hypothetical protein
MADYQSVVRCVRRCVRLRRCVPVVGFVFVLLFVFAFVFMGFVVAAGVGVGTGAGCTVVAVASAGSVAPPSETQALQPPRSACTCV